MTLKELEADKGADEFDPLICCDFSKQLYEFGKELGFKTEGLLSDFFADQSVQKHFSCDSELKLAGPNFLKGVIAFYTSQTFQMYDELTQEVNPSYISQEHAQKMHKHIASKM